jgi:hypothetical protein
LRRALNVPSSGHACIGKPPRKFGAATVTCGRGLLRLAIRAVCGAAEAHMKMRVVAPPRAESRQPGRARSLAPPAAKYSSGPGRCWQQRRQPPLRTHGAVPEVLTSPTTAHQIPYRAFHAAGIEPQEPALTHSRDELTARHCPRSGPPQTCGAPGARPRDQPGQPRDDWACPEGRSSRPHR